MITANSHVLFYIDISKAFGRVWHKGLLFKLKEHGIGDNLLTWLTSYLNNRKQKVVIQASESSLLPLKAGVLQGSVLGPLLFIIYVNDITQSLLSLTRIYEDDSSLFYSATSLQDLEGILNHDLTVVSKWAKQRLVDFNQNKTEAVIFSTKRDLGESELIFESTKIRIVDQHKHLGLTLSSSAQWNDHINDSLETASKVIHIMRRLQFTLTCAALNQIYLSYVRPILEYASIVWDGCSKTSSDSFEKLQNEAARIVTGLTRSVSLEKLNKECGWETLESRRKSFKLHFMFKVSNNLVPHYVEELIPPLVGNRTQYEFSDSQNFDNFYARTSLLQKSCIPSSICLWNNLEQEIRNSTSISSFKSKVSKMTMTKPTKIPNIYCIGNRNISVLHARLRNNCSNLNEDLYQNHLRLDPMCEYGNEIENAENYFF